ncbi:DUF58 domain-containing protein [Citrifermentans bemidjiense]|uniref:DUF58 domain-containing protein n=1 Tax=Citrifermentans bemidjiense TaxID=225194 RepID=UPI00014FA87D|nr:DUF58 domain-containing protein [Citrifermentans bemidjiense]
MGVSAVNTGNNLLFLIVAAMLGFMAVTGVLGWLNLRGLSARVQLPDEVYAGTTTPLSVHLENRKKLLPSFLIDIGVSSGFVWFLMLQPRRPESASLFLTFSSRGSSSLPSAVISSRFPVNFFIRYSRIDLPATFIVFPAPRPLGLALQGGKPDTGEAVAAAAPGYEGDLAKISDYRGGEPLKLIHWRLSAKHDVFKVKELSATAGEPLTLDLERIPGRDLEQRLCACCFLVNRLVKGGRQVGLRLGEKVIAPAAPTRGHRLKLLGELALYGEAKD